MSKKIITFSLIAALFMFVRINVKAADNCPTAQGTTSAYCSANAEGVTCAAPSDGTCGENCTYVAPASYNNGCVLGVPSDCRVDSSDNSCYCPTPSAPSLSGCGGTYSKASDSYPGNCGLSTSPNTLSSCKASGLGTVTAGGHVTITGSPTGSSCIGYVTVTCYATNNCGAESSSSSSKKIKVIAGWSTKGTPVKGGMDPDTMGGMDRKWAEGGNHNVYYAQDPSTGEWKKYTRGSNCGSNPTIPETACFRDKRTGFLYWDYEAQDAQKNQKSTTQTTYQVYDVYVKDDDGLGKNWHARTNYEVVDDIDNEKDCKTQFGCTLPVYPKDKNVETTCNSIGDISSSDQDYHKQCGVKAGGKVDDKIYSITCRETMKTAFNGPVWDSNHSFMYPGTGFGFNYQVKTKVACDGTWNKSFYEKALKYTEEYLDAHKAHQGSGVAQDGVNDVADQYWYASAKSGMEDIKKSYINWSLKSIYFSTSKTPANGTIGDDQSELSRSNGRVKDEYKENLELEKEYNSTQPTAECYSKTSSGASTQSVPDNFKYQVAYTFNFRLPLLYYTNKGTYTTEDCATCGKLGRIFPISENEEYAGNIKYVYKVDINNLGMNHNWKNYETCSIGDGMKKKDIVFRQVNLSDPFIQKLSNSNHKIGRNWKNDKYDFTNVIDANIWNKDSQYNTVSIDQDIGKVIKAELSNQANSYIGSCSKQTSNGATPTICGLYNQARKK